MQGYLKLGRETGDHSVKIWDRFYFKRESDRLVYSSDEYDPIPLGHIDLSILTSVDISKKDERIFKIHTKVKNYECLVDTPGIANQWLKALRDWKDSHQSLLLEEMEEFKQVLKQKEEEDKHVRSLDTLSYNLGSRRNRSWNWEAKARTDRKNLTKAEG